MSRLEPSASHFQTSQFCQSAPPIQRLDRFYEIVGFFAAAADRTGEAHGRTSTSDP